MEICPDSNHSALNRRETSFLMMMDLNEIHTWLIEAGRSLGAEVTSPWFYLQLGIILASSGIAFAVGTAVRSKGDLTSRGVGWAAPPRLFLPGFFGSGFTPNFGIFLGVVPTLLA